jgi:hypothetical protein
MHCMYCDKNYVKNTEHVFPEGLGGQKIYMNCVCHECNNKFSSLEGELYEKSPLAFIRNVEGIGEMGESKKKESLFKAPVLLAFDEITGIAYEAGQSSRLKVFVRPQIILIDTQFYAEGNTTEGLAVLVSAWNTWKKQNLRLVVKQHQGELRVLKVLEFLNDPPHFSVKSVDQLVKTTDSEIRIDSLDESHVLYSRLN